MSWRKVVLLTKCLLMPRQRQKCSWCSMMLRMLEIFYPLGSQKQTTYGFVAVRQCIHSGSCIVVFINSVWLTVGSDKFLKKGNFLNCNRKKSGAKTKKDICSESNCDLKDQIGVKRMVNADRAKSAIMWLRLGDFHTYFLAINIV